MLYSSICFRSLDSEKTSYQYMQKGGYNKRGSLISDEVRLHGAGGCGPHCLRGRAGSKAFLQPFKAAGEDGGLAWYHEDRERCRREGA